MLNFNTYNQFNKELTKIIEESYNAELSKYKIIQESNEIVYVNEGLGSFLGSIFKGAVKIAGKMVTLDGYLTPFLKNAFSIRARILDYLGAKYEDILIKMVEDKKNKVKNYADPYSIKILFNKAEDAYTKESDSDGYDKQSKNDTARLKKYWQNKVLKIQSKYKDVLTPDEMNPLMKISVKKSDMEKFKDVDKYLDKADKMDDEANDNTTSGDDKETSFKLIWGNKSFDAYYQTTVYNYNMYLINNDKNFNTTLKNAMDAGQIDSTEFTDIIAISNKKLNAKNLIDNELSLYLYVINKTDEMAYCYNYNNTTKGTIVMSMEDVKDDISGVKNNFKINNIDKIDKPSLKKSPKFSKKTYYEKIAKLHDKIIELKNK